ncbi:DEAD/DEAH box helicase [Saccharibacillus sp. O23]|uniref:DEAD/DEAH box helicase n=1 Tax=Saccharibacillus sp. O23 TaxID=2009338 RepID=UPI000B4E20B3|nr:DEAD/DEAH box helicase [Saccharibacillus sp. O23]OWR31095.1 DEAD/DEAH box helicase [Saccharibacillus sp. O23]
MTFNDLNLIPSILKALQKENYTNPTPIQQQAIPVALEGRDVLGCAQTGTGKTAAFSLPIIQRLAAQPAAGGKRPIRSLILTPTRELAIQIYDNIQAYSRYTDLRSQVIVGGVSQTPQERELQRGTDILIATPGRLLDLMNQKHVSLNAVEVLVLDEADRMLDMGFIRDVQKIIAKTPAKKQTLFFSATMPKEITELVDSLLVNPAKVEITPVSSTVEVIQQSVYLVDKPNKQKLLTDLLQDKSIESALVFTRTKHGANRVARLLERSGISAQAIHGDKSQNARQTALNNFKNGATRVLVATDIAARGIDIDELSHVINFNLPNIPETYVHRIGRTGRAGRAGVSISFCETEELPYLKDIQKLIGKTIPEIKDHAYPMTGETPAASTDSSAQSGRGQGGRARTNGAPKSEAPAAASKRGDAKAGKAKSDARPNGAPKSEAPAAASKRGDAKAGKAKSDARPSGAPKSEAPAAASKRGDAKAGKAKSDARPSGAPKSEAPAGGAAAGKSRSAQKPQSGSRAGADAKRGRGLGGRPQPGTAASARANANRTWKDGQWAADTLYRSSHGLSGDKA